MKIFLTLLLLANSALAGGPLPEEVVRSIDFDTPSKSGLCENKIDYHEVSRHSGLYTVSLERVPVRPVAFSIEDRWALAAVAGRNPIRKWNFWFTSPQSAMIVSVQDTPIVLAQGDKAQIDKTAVRTRTFLLFPRRQLPSLRYSRKRGELEVTLTTGERVVFDAQTRKVKAGVFAEVPAKTDARKILSGGEPHFPSSELIYKGTGVWIEDKDGAEDAVVHKGSRTCALPRTDFFPQGQEDCVRFPFKTDAQLSAHLKARCGFSLELK